MVLRSFFPISITWNHDSPVSSYELEQFKDKTDKKRYFKELSSSIAMRIAYSVFVVGGKNTSWSTFRDRWEQTTALCSDTTPFVQRVLDEVLEHLDNRKILIIADEPVQTGIPRLVRNELYKSFWEVQPNGRIVISSLNPRQLPRDPSAVPTTYVQLSRHSPNDIQTVLDSCGWLSDADSTTKSHALYSFSIPSTQWRAIAYLFEKYSTNVPSGNNSTIECLSSAQKTVRSTLKTIGHLFHIDQPWLHVVNELLVHTILGQRVDFRDSSKEIFAGHNASYWVHNGILANSIPASGSNVPELDVPEIPMSIIHNWLESESHESKNDLVTLVSKLWEHAQISIYPQASSSRRFEHLMAHWTSLFLHCAIYGGHQEVSLVSESKYDCPVLFPRYEKLGDHDRPAISIGQ